MDIDTSIVDKAKESVESVAADAKDALHKRSRAKRTRRLRSRLIGSAVGAGVVVALWLLARNRSTTYR